MNSIFRATCELVPVPKGHGMAKEALKRLCSYDPNYCGLCGLVFERPEDVFEVWGLELFSVVGPGADGRLRVRVHIKCIDVEISH